MFSKYYSRLVKIYKSRRQTGQILIIFLLILVVGLALVLSVASRSITDIRITTTSDESNRAYFAAEAGIEEALKRLQQPSTTSEFTAELDFTAVNKTTAKVKSSDLSSTSGAYLLLDALERDAVAQVNLLKDFNKLNGPPPPSAVTAVGTETLTIYWGAQGVSPNPAIEITVLHHNAAGTWGLEKYAFDPDNTHGNNFGSLQCITTPSNPIPTDQGNIYFENQINLRIRQGYSGVLPVTPPDRCGVAMAGVSADPVLARIRLLYNDVPHPVAVEATNGWVLPSQGSEVESTGSTDSGVTRKLKVRQQFPALPSIFDYVLFSGGDLTK